MNFSKIRSLGTHFNLNLGLIWRFSSQISLQNWKICQIRVVMRKNPLQVTSDLQRVFPYDHFAIWRIFQLCSRIFNHLSTNLVIKISRLSLKSVSSSSSIWNTSWTNLWSNPVAKSSCGFWVSLSNQNYLR